MCISLLVIIAKIKAHPKGISFGAQAEGNGSALSKARNTDIGYFDRNPLRASIFLLHNFVAAHKCGMTTQSSPRRIVKQK
jgi:hypothetical protein